ncbi:MAG: hypothetical protein ACR2PQ_12735 [Myxococcota bacterium]
MRVFGVWLLTLTLVPWLVGAKCWVPLLPPLVSSSPGVGETVPRSVWPVLNFSSVLPAGIPAVGLSCAGALVEFTTAEIDADTLVVQPATLPAGAACQLEVLTTNGAETIAFQTAAAGSTFEVVFDRTEPSSPLPFPDDFHLAPDAGNPTGWRLDITLPDATSVAAILLENLSTRAEAESDGWSPLGNLTVELSSAADPASLPLDRAASLDPLSTVALFDMTPGSDTFGERIPFNLIPRSDTIAPAPPVHTLVIFPGVPLEPQGVYGLVVTDRVLGGGEPLARSAFFDAAMAAPVGGEAPEIAATRPLVDEVAAVAEQASPVPIPRGDIVAAARITVRSTDHFVDDVLAMKEDVDATPPNVQISTVDSDPDGDVAAIVTGTFDVPVWLDNGTFVTRGADGLPEASGTQAIPFVLGLPTGAETVGHAPVVMYQHGNPGSSENEVPGAIRSFLGQAGFAVGGFTDRPNRQFANIDVQVQSILATVLQTGSSPDYYIQTYAEQIAFVRALQSLDTLDVLPIGAPDGVPDLDPSVLVYEGISYGSTHAAGFLAYEPDIAAAALVAGAGGFAALVEYQDRTVPLGGLPLIRVQLPAFIAGLRMADFWMGLQLFAVNYDRQEPHDHARFLFREPLSVEGTTQKASILLVEGIDDSFTANNSTRSLAWQLGGIPQLSPAPEPVPDLPQQFGPIQGNVDPNTTAAMVQYVPDGLAIPFTPGCQFEFEGHFCAQTNPTARDQRVSFYESALTGVPSIE